MQLGAREREGKRGKALNWQLVEYIVWNVLGLTNGVITGNGRYSRDRGEDERVSTTVHHPTGGNFTTTQLLER